MTPGENVLVLCASGVGALFAAVRIAHVNQSWLVIAVVAVMGFDIFGGAVCNATATTRAWYHRDGKGWRDHLLFVAPHLAYVAVVAAMLRPQRVDAPYGLALSLGILVGAAAIIAAPGRLKTPIAFIAYLILSIGMILSFGPTPGLEWFVPALLLKLFVGHLVGPDQRRQAPAFGG
jgi:hypothetical protein